VGFFVGFATTSTFNACVWTFAIAAVLLQIS